jgi:hypothetical protein
MVPKSATALVHTVADFGTTTLVNFFSLAERGRFAA